MREIKEKLKEIKETIKKLDKNISIINVITGVGITLLLIVTKNKEIITYLLLFWIINGIKDFAVLIQINEKYKELSKIISELEKNKN